MGARILVVEHHKANVEEMMARLTPNGHELFVAADPENGVAAARRHRPQLILCAIAPPSSGARLLFRVLLDASFDNIPIVAVTMLFGERDSLLSLGFAGAIEKPLSDAFASQVESFLPK